MSVAQLTYIVPNLIDKGIAEEVLLLVVGNDTTSGYVSFAFTDLLYYKEKINNGRR